MGMGVKFGKVECFAKERKQKHNRLSISANSLVRVDWVGLGRG